MFLGLFALIAMIIQVFALGSIFADMAWGVQLTVVVGCLAVNAGVFWVLAKLLADIRKKK